jgi:hypothetical protein
MYADVTMGILRFVTWTAVCIGLGIGMATFEVAGRTPVSHLERLWRQRAAKLEKVKEAGQELADEVRRKVGSSTPAEPKERHDQADRDAVADIISRRQKSL